MRDDASQLDAERLNRIVRRAIEGDHELVPLPLDDLADWHDEIEGAAQLGLAQAWSRGWRSDKVLIEAARNAAVNEALAEQRRRGVMIRNSGELERIAKRVSADPYDLADDVISSGEPDPPAGIELDEQASKARAALDGLKSDLQRRAIELCVMHGKSQREAAQELGIAQQRVSELVSAGLETLRECMEG